MIKKTKTSKNKNEQKQNKKIYYDKLSSVEKTIIYKLITKFV